MPLEVLVLDVMPLELPPVEVDVLLPPDDVEEVDEVEDVVDVLLPFP